MGAPQKVAALYGFLAAFWIIVSDTVLPALPGEATAFAGTAKGLLFVGVTALALYLLLRREESHRVRSDRRLEVFERRYEQLFQGHGQAMIVVDPADGRILDANAAACCFYGYELAELRRMTVFNINPHTSSECLKARIETILQGRLNRFDARHRLRTGEFRDVEVYTTPVQLDGQVVLHSIVHDVTDRLRAEEARIDELVVSESMVSLYSLLLGQTRLNIKAIADDVLANALALTGSRFGFVGYRDEKTGFMVSPSLPKHPWDICGEATKTGVLTELPGLFARVVRDQKPIILNRPCEDRAFADTAAGTVPIEQFVAAPALFGGEVVGLIALANTGRDYSVRDRRLLERLALLLSLTIRRWRTEQALAESEERYRTLVEAVPEGILVHQNQTVVFANQASAHYFGADGPGALVARPSITLIAETHRHAAAERVEKLLKDGGKIKRPLLVFRRLDGSEFTGESRSVRIEFRGQPAALAIFRDISDRKAIEAELVEARDRADAANRAKSQFLATVSHELRTPLTAIIGFSEMLTAKNGIAIDNQTMAEYAEQIYKSGSQLLGMVNDILELSRFEGGTGYLSPLYLDTVGFLKGVERMVIGQAAQRRINFSIDTGANPFDIHADRNGLRQVLLSVIGNAIKFTPNDGHVHVAVRWDGERQVSIIVSDTGIGIPNDRLEQVFEPFSQVENPYSRRFGGAGLGLTLARTIVVQHGGTLGIESTEGVGTTVTINLPQPVVLRLPPEARSIRAVG